MWCSHCGEPRNRETDTKLATDNSIRCNYCGQRCRVKPKYNHRKYTKLHPYVRVGRLGRSQIRNEILALAKRKGLE